MFIKKIIFATIILILTATITASAQNKLPLKDTITDSSGSLRYFSLNENTLAKKPSDAVTVLKNALGTNNSTDFKLVKIKERDNSRKSILYQQTYKNIPVYNGYYYLHFINDSLAYANGEYTSIERLGNSLKITDTVATEKAIQSVNITWQKPISISAELVLWRKDTKSDYLYVYKVEIVFSDASKSKVCMIDAATGKALAISDLVCSVNIYCLRRKHGIQRH